MSAPSPLAAIGPYRIQAELGRGGMGVVYLALDPGIGRQVAVKVIRKDPYADAEQISELRLRLSREAAAAGRLNHPGIVTVYHLGEHEELLYIAMEYVEGVPLDHLLKAGSLRQPRQAVGLLEQVADALDYAHSMGVVHRDVKPANILVRADGKAKITDFGIARICSQNVTLTGFALGTPEFMSPEQIMASPIDGRADQFSLAVMAFFMLSGRKPFEAPTANALMMQIVQAEPLRLNEVDPRLPSAAARVIDKALAKSPADRFATCQEFVAALGTALGACPAHSRAQPVLPPKLKPVSTRTAFGIAAALAVVGAIGAAWLFWTPQQAAPRKARTVALDSHPPTASRSTPPEEPAPPAAMENPRDGLTYVLVSSAAPTGGQIPFYLTRTEITASAFARFRPGGNLRGNGPATGVTWDDARSYCEWAGGRLPTETEWDFAAGSGYAQPAGRALSDIAWFSGNSGSKVHEVGTKLPNEFGLYDMAGNVWEWVAGSRAGRQSRHSERILRGGSARSGSPHVGVAARWSLDPRLKDSTIGFRCAIDVPSGNHASLPTTR